MRALALLAGALCLVAAGVLLWTRVADDDGADGAVVHDRQDEAHAPVRLEGRPGAVPVETADREQAEPPRSSRVVLRGTIRVADPAVTVTVHAWIRTARFESVDHPGLGTKRVGPGSFELDVTELIEFLRVRKRRPELFVRPMAPGHVGVRMQLPLPPSDELLRGNAAIEPVDLVLAPAATVFGRVYGPDDRPLASADVALFPLTPNGPETEAVADGASDEGGRFSLAARHAGRHLLVASWLALDGNDLAQRPLPASVVVDLTVGEESKEIDLHLRPSLTVRGRVRVDGKPVDRATVDWRLAGDATPLRDSFDSHFQSDAWLWYQDGTVHWARDPVETDAQGHFEILGASGVPYHLFVEGVPGAHIHQMAKEKAEVEVTPPAATVRLDLHLARLVLHARLDGKPLQLLDKVHVADVGMHPDLPDEVCWGNHFAEADVDGRLEVGLTPGHTYVVDLREPGYETWWKNLVAPAAGETLTLVAELERERPKPRLVVVLEGEGASELALATFGFYESDVDPATRSPYPIRAVTPQDGRFVVEDLVPGPHVMHVIPGRGWYDVPTDWMRAIAAVEIPQTGEVEVRVPVTRGGRLLLEVSDLDGRFPECPCSIRGPSGETLAAQFIVETDADGFVLSNELPGIGPAWVVRALEPGTYEVVLEPEGYAREVRTIEVRRGAAATLRVTLRRP